MGGSILITELKTAWHQQDVLLFPSHRVTHASAISLVATVGELCAGTLPPQKAPPPCLIQHPASGQACQTRDRGQTTHQNMPSPGPTKLPWETAAPRSKRGKQGQSPRSRDPGHLETSAPVGQLRHWTCFLLCNYVNEPVRASCTAGQGPVSNAATAAASQGDLLKQPTGSDLGGQPQGRGPLTGYLLSGELPISTDRQRPGRHSLGKTGTPRIRRQGLSWRVIPT